jgi:hypothetical protein
MTKIVKCCVAVAAGLTVPLRIAALRPAAADIANGVSDTPLKLPEMFETAPVGEMFVLQYQAYDAGLTDATKNPCCANGLGFDDSVELTYVDKPTWTARELGKAVIRSYISGPNQPSLTLGESRTVEYSYSAGLTIPIKVIELSFNFTYSTTSTVSKGAQQYYEPPGQGKKTVVYLGNDLTERTGIVWKVRQTVIYGFRTPSVYNCEYGRFLVNVEQGNLTTSYAGWRDPVVPRDKGILVAQAVPDKNGVERSFTSGFAVYYRRPVAANQVAAGPDRPDPPESDQVYLKFDELPNTKLSSKNWVGIYKRGDRAGQATPVKKVFIPADPKGIVEFPTEELPGGDYDAYLFFNGTVELLSGYVAKFTIREAGTLTLSKSTYRVGDLINVTFATNSPTIGNKVGIYTLDGTPMGDYSTANSPLVHRWSWARRSTGTVSLPTAGLAPGKYQIRYLYNNGSTRLAAPAPVTLTE